MDSSKKWTAGEKRAVELLNELVAAMEGLKKLESKNVESLAREMCYEILDAVEADGCGGCLLCQG